MLIFEIRASWKWLRNRSRIHTNDSKMPKCTSFTNELRIKWQEIISLPLAMFFAQLYHMGTVCPKACGWKFIFKNLESPFLKKTKQTRLCIFTGVPINHKCKTHLLLTFCGSTPSLPRCSSIQQGKPSMSSSILSLNLLFKRFKACTLTSFKQELRYLIVNNHHTSSHSCW